MSPGEEPLLIERVRPEDLAAVVRLFSLLGPRYTCNPEDPRSRKVFDLYVSDQQKFGLVARLGDRIVGVILFEITPLLAPTYLQGRADGMVVDPAYRRRGIAHKLLRQALAIGKQRGVTSFLIKASDPEVIAIYRRMEELQERGVYFYYNPDPGLVEAGGEIGGSSTTHDEDP